MSCTKTHAFDFNVTERIISYMRYHGYTIKKVADMTGLSYNQLYQILKKNQLIKLSDYIRICKAFDVPFEAFIEGLNAET